MAARLVVLKPLICDVVSDAIWTVLNDSIAPAARPFKSVVVSALTCVVVMPPNCAVLSAFISLP